MKKRIPVRIDPVAEADGSSSIEVFMDLVDFETYGTSVRNDIGEFRKDYLDIVKKARVADSRGRGVSTRQRWRVCRMLADFNRKMANKFEITNYKQAYSRDFGLPMRSIRTYLDFGRYFEDDEVVDGIPYSIYAELCFRIRGLVDSGKFESEKKRLLQMYREGNMPRRDDYRVQLKTA